MDKSDQPAQSGDGLPDEPVVIPPPGGDPDSQIRAAKTQLASGDPAVDDHARGQLERAGRRRALMLERDTATDERRAAIDDELGALGGDDPAPAGRASRQDQQQTAAKTGPTAAAAERGGPAGVEKPGKPTA